MAKAVLAKAAFAFFSLVTNKMKKLIQIFSLISLLCFAITAQQNPAITEAPQKVSAANDTGDWIIGQYNDKFGEKTDKSYITTKNYLKGTFNNSATRNSELLVNVLYDLENGLAFEFKEYGRNEYSAIFDSESFSLSIVDANGTQHEYRSAGFISKDSFRMYIAMSISKKKRNKEAEEILGFLLSGGTVKFLLTNNSRRSHSFRFDIDTEGFSSAHKILSEPKKTAEQPKETSKPNK